MTVDTLEPATASDDTHLPGDINLWVFVLGDLVIFALYFVVFMVYHLQHHELFLQSQRQLSLTAGAVNTLVLLASSRFVATAVQAARDDDRQRARRMMYAAAALGLTFLAIKAVEWHALIGAGYTLPHNEFFMFYFMLTGIHLVHVLLGLGILAIAVREVRSTGPGRVWVVEVGATFWHMVDLLWVVIFALLYLMR